MIFTLLTINYNNHKLIELMKCFEFVYIPLSKTLKLSEAAKISVSATVKFT